MLNSHGPDLSEHLLSGFPERLQARAEATYASLEAHRSEALERLWTGMRRRRRREREACGIVVTRAELDAALAWYQAYQLTVAVVPWAEPGKLVVLAQSEAVPAPQRRTVAAHVAGAGWAVALTELVVEELGTPATAVQDGWRLVDAQRRLAGQLATGRGA